MMMDVRSVQITPQDDPEQVMLALINLLCDPGYVGRSKEQEDLTLTPAGYRQALAEIQEVRD